MPDKWRIAHFLSTKDDPVGAWLEPKYKGCNQKPMNSHYYAARFGKFSGFFNKKTVEKLSLVIEATLIGWPLTLSSSALKLTNISTFDC